MGSHSIVKGERVTAADALRGRTKLLGSDFDGCIATYGVPYQTDPQVGRLADLIRSRRGIEFAVVSGGRLGRLREFADDVNAVLFAENGGVMYVPQGRHGSGTKVLVDQDKVDLILRTVVPLADGFLSSAFPGYDRHDKLTMVTYEKPAGVDMDEFRRGFEEFAVSLPLDVRKRIAMTHTDRLIDVVYAGENKSKAVERMLSLFNYKGPESAYVGDGSNDIPGFRVMDARGGWIVTPANSDRMVKEYVRQSGSPRIIEHPLESTDCMMDLVSALRK